MNVSGDSLEKQCFELRAEVTSQDASGRVRTLRSRIEGRIVFTTSFGLEDQALTHLIADAGLPIEIVTLDTGRLFPQTYDVWRRTEERYGLRIRAYYPDTAEIEALVAAQGVDGFFGSVDARQACCRVRKVAPLARALDGARAWIAGLRASQSAHRESAGVVEFDPERGLLKVNPLIDWDRADVDQFVARHDVPVNALHAQGFPSIGCAPCTRAVEPGEDERAGRWWWERGAKECGLHVGADGRLTRVNADAGVRP